jgi:hypothetical protein
MYKDKQFNLGLVLKCKKCPYTNDALYLEKKFKELEGGKNETN